MGLTFSDECRSKVRAEIEKCNKNLVDGVTYFTINQVFSESGFSSLAGPGGPGINYGDGNEDMNDLSLFVENPIFTTVKTKMFEEVRKEVFNAERFKHLQQTVFPRVKRELIKQIESKVSDPSAKEQMKKKIAATSWTDLRCFEDHNHDKSISAFFIPNAYYKPRANTFNYCNGYMLSTSSDFQAVNEAVAKVRHS